MFDDARERAARWLARAGEAVSVRDPYAGALRLAQREAGLEVAFDDLLEHWRASVEGCSGELRRYPWLLSYRRWINPPAYAGPFEDFQSWREAERQLNTGGLLSYYVATQVAICANGEILEEQAQAGDAVARGLIDRFVPVMRKDFALRIVGEHPWTDTFALWNLVRARLLFKRLQPLAVALGTTFAASAAGGAVAGVGFPYHDVKLASASAHLAQGLLSVGMETPLVAALLAFLRAQRRPSGGWGDGSDPEELLTTFVAADLLSSIDPEFDLSEAAAFILGAQQPDGCWRVMGPEIPWLTGEIRRWLGAAALPFAQRFRWPRTSESTIDAKTQVPGFGYFRQHAELCAGLPGLAKSPAEMAFLDLAGFKTFNDRFGQDLGDEVIVVLARALDAIPGTRAVRDGGDEFLILAPPTDTSLEEKLRAFLGRWPALFHERFGADAPVVAPRICMAGSTGGALRELRERLGRSITLLKKESPRPEPTGALKRLAG